MNDIVIDVDNLGKKFGKYASAASYFCFREQIAEFFAKPFRYFKKSGFQHQENEFFWALQNLQFQVRHGEALAIVGNNGAGKSTLLKILSKITKPTTGTVKIRGRIASLLEVGTGFHPELTGRENIFLNGSILSMSRREIRNKFDEIVEFAEIGNFVDTPVKHYSTGMYTRLAFSVAASLDPEILIIDEVLAVGDVRFQKKCLGKMNDVAKSGRTVLFVSHNLTAVQSLCSRAILLDKGKILEDNTSQNVVRKYLESFSQTQNFIEWAEDKRPGNGHLKVIRVEVLDVEEKKRSNYPISQPIRIAITYEMKSDNSYAGFSLVLYKGHEECVCSSFNNQEPNYYGKNMPKGIYRTECVIPANLLNDGTYSCSLNGYSAMRTNLFTVERFISFETYDDGGFNNDFFGDHTGCIRPRFTWSTHAQTPFSYDKQSTLAPIG